MSADNVITQELDSLRARVIKQAAVILREEGENAIRGMRWKMRMYPHGGGSNLNIRSRRLERSIGYKVMPSTDGASMLIGVMSDDRETILAAETQESGADIKAKNAEKLLIPVGAGLRADGTPAYRTLAQAKRDFTLHLTPTAVLGRPRKHLRSGMTDRTQPTFGSRYAVLYARRESVHIPPRPFVGPQIEPLLKRVTERLEAIS